MRALDSDDNLQLFRVLDGISALFLRHNRISMSQIDSTKQKTLKLTITCNKTSFQPENAAFSNKMNFFSKK